MLINEEFIYMAPIDLKRSESLKFANAQNSKQLDAVTASSNATNRSVWRRSMSRLLTAFITLRPISTVSEIIHPRGNITILFFW